jgi:hypothetical protein
MRSKTWPIISLITVFAMLISPVGAAGSVNAVVSDQRTFSTQAGMRIVEPSFVGVSQPLSSLVPVIADSHTPSALRLMQDRLVIPKTVNALSSGGFDTSIVQNGPVKNTMPTPEANFEGVDNVSGVLPPDTQGDMGWNPATGTKYYVQWVNLAFEIWDVTIPSAPVSLYGPAAGNTLWAGTGTICEANNDGDPITQFDHLANRWLMSQFALSFPDNFHQCIAISATADPTGVWFLYDYQTSTTVMNDYPKFGVWPDGYYMTVNQFDGTTEDWAGAGVAVFEREVMLQGLTARMIYLDLGLVTTDYGGMLPSDLDGPAPAAGTPNYFMEWDDSSWLGDPNDTLRIWEFDVDWAVPANTTFGANASYDPNLTLATANVDYNMCGGSRSCVDQPDTTVGLDAIADRLMYRLQYRDYGPYQVLVGNHTVDADGADHAGIHWFELRDTGAGFGMYQESVYAGDVANTNSRWMGSIAADEDGNMALGYSVSGAAVYPSVRFTGRLATDPLNGLTQGETSMIAGTGSQTSSYSRWGDYSMMAVDASDGCTFWYTQEYIQTTGSSDWQTRIGSFKFPSCTTAPTGLLAGTVTDGSNPISGALISVSGGYTTTTDSTGYYELSVVDGTYDVTASKYGYVTGTVNGLVVTAPYTTTQDFVLAAAPTATISGVVTDSTTGWPLYASIAIFGYPGVPVFTDPVTGAYTVELMDGSYTFTVSALSGGYTDVVTPIVVAGDATQNFSLAADLAACSAPGYVPSGLMETFETWPLNGWTILDNIPGGGLTWNTNTFHGEGNYTGGSGLAATVSSDNVDGGEYNTELRSPVINLASLADLNLEYKVNYQDYTSYDAFDFDISINDGSSWTTISHWTTDHGTLHGTGETVNVDLTSYATDDFMLRWRYYTSESDPWDWYAQIDEVNLGGCSLIPSAGLVVGVVRDGNTAVTINNATVEDAATNQALFIDNSADISQASPLFIIAEPAGAVNLTASAPLYADNTLSPLVISGSVVRQDFNLTAGMLSATPTSMTFDHSATLITSTQQATLANEGGVNTGYEIFTIPGDFLGYTPTGPFAPNTRHFGPKNLNDRDSSRIRIPYTPPAVSILDAGTIASSWATGLTYAWGIGFNTDDIDLWLGNIGAGGGDDLDYRFTTAGVNTGDTIDTSPWLGVFGGDMTYNPFTNRLWQVNVGGDNCIYELDPATKLSTGNRMCPAFGTAERGLAFDPITNTYYAGSWNDGIINHFAPDGTLLASVNVNLAIAGLAYNPATGHLFVFNNEVAATSLDIHVLDTNTPGYDSVGAFDITDGSGTSVLTDYSQAGLEIDCDGNLWAVDQNLQVVYAVESGETGVCDWQPAWLTTDPLSGSVVASGSSIVDVNVDSTGMAVGTYHAYLRIVNQTPYGDEILPVTLNIADNEAPVITSDGGGDTASKDVAENTTAVTTVTATDVDDDTLSFSIVGGADAALFNIDASTGELTFLSPPDFENPVDSDANNIYEVIVQVSDGLLTDTQTLTITVTDVIIEYWLSLPMIMRW